MSIQSAISGKVLWKQLYGMRNIFQYMTYCMLSMLMKYIKRIVLYLEMKYEIEKSYLNMF